MPTPLFPRRAAAAALVLASVAAVAALAAPFVPGRRPLPPEVLSLADLTVLQLEVADLSSTYTDAGLRSENIRDQVTRRLTDAGIELREDSDMPRLVVKLATLVDEDQPDAVCVYVVMGIHQDVTVNRLKRSMLLPTATVATGKLCTKAKLVGVAQDEVGNLTDRITRFIRQATEAPK